MRSTRAFPNPLATVQHAVDHIDHIVSVAGIDHVGIGCDFDGGGGIEGVFDASEVMNITIELVRRGYSEEEIGKIWSGNLLRVFREVQALAEQKATKARYLMEARKRAALCLVLLVYCVDLQAHALRLSLCQIEYASVEKQQLTIELRLVPHGC